MADLDGYINPRSLGNNEPNNAFRMDVFFERALWDKYIDNKNTRRRDLCTWDSMAPFYMEATMGGLARKYATREPVPGETITSYQVKIGHHAPCACHAYHHKDTMALCIGLQ
jgi:hypothetical protein